jgi:hypothetical protein
VAVLRGKTAKWGNRQIVAPERDERRGEQARPRPPRIAETMMGMTRMISRGRCAKAVAIAMRTSRVPTLRRVAIR